MREINVIFEVVSSGPIYFAIGRFFTYDDGGKTIVPEEQFGPSCRTKNAAEDFARRGTISVYHAAESDNLRFDQAKAYLNARKARVAVPAAQLELL